MSLKVVAISDVHCKWNSVTIPECDLLISAGDYSFLGEPHVVKDFHKWLDEQPANHIISLQGNHEKQVERNFLLSKQIAEEACPGVHFIDEGLVEIEGKNIWCSAITPFFCNWAWNRYPGENIQKHWDRIPNTEKNPLHILVTHGPPYGILDEVKGFYGKNGEYEPKNCGCPQLLKKVLEIKPEVHIFGHIHPAFGSLIREDIRFFNASICDDSYKAVNPVTIFEL